MQYPGKARLSGMLSTSRLSPFSQETPGRDAAETAARCAVQPLLEPSEQIRLAAATDIDENGRFQESWLVVTDLRVLVVQKPPGPAETGEPRPPAIVEEFSLFSIDEAKTLDFVGNGALALNLRPLEDTDEESLHVEVLRFSRSLVERFADAATTITEMARDAATGFDEHGENDHRISSPRPRKRCEKCDRPFPQGTDFCPYCLNKGAVIVRLLAYLRPYRRETLTALFLTACVTLLGLTPPYLTKVLIDQVFPLHDFFLFWLICGAYIGRYVFSAGLSAINMKIVTRIGQSIIFDLRTHLCRHLQDLSLSYYDKRHVGAVMSRVMNDTSAINQFLVSGVQNFLINVFTLIFIGIIMFGFDWRLALLALAPTPLMIILTRWYGGRITPIYRRYWATVSSMNATLATAISGVRVVKSFAQEQREVDRFTTSARDFYDTNVASTKVNMLYSPVLTVLTGLGAVLVWIVGGWQVLHGQLTVGTILMFTGYMWQFFAPVQSLCNLNDSLQNAATAGERIFQLLDTCSEVTDRPDAAAPAVEGHVEFDNVTFYYDNADGSPPVLRNITFEANPGELVGLVGHSGSGKTSIVNLLLRFYDRTEGAIRIDGRDIRELDSRALREQIGMVLQEPFLFSGTISDNINYGRPDASPDETIAAAEAANAHRFIMNFPDGYDTEVGERGVKLSGGEKQRISIARAILNNPKIMILDEATSAVDTETEMLIQQAMERLMEGRTTIAIAHRLSTLKNADKLIVLDKGQIVEMGTHHELLSLQDGVYAKLVRIQTEMARTERVES